jgi:multiple sugar transport system ATP-binding protein
MDEPLSNLDAQLRVEMRAELVELHAQLGITIIYVTHDQIEATTMGQRIAVMKDGALQQLDTPRVVHERPANAFVAGFVGSPPMNVLAGTVVSVDGRLSVEVAGGTVPLSPADAAIISGSGLQEVVVGARPEDLWLDPAGTVTATVSLVEASGRDQHVACRLRDGKLVMIESDVGRAMTVGENVRLAVRGPLHLFHPESQLRLGS